MPTRVESVTTAALAAALDAAARRQSLSAANIANAGTEGYVPLRISFEAKLEDARGVVREQGRIDANGLALLQELAESLPEPIDAMASVQLDAEVAELARNAVQFQVLLQGVSRHLALLALAAADGRK